MILRKMKKRGFILGDVSAWWVIAITVLVLVLFFYFILKIKGADAIGFFKNLWRFR